MPGTQPAPVGILLVGFDEAGFARVGAALVSPVYLNLSRWQKFWVRFGLSIIVLAAAGCTSGISPQTPRRANLS